MGTIRDLNLMAAAVVAADEIVLSDTSDTNDPDKRLPLSSFGGFRSSWTPAITASSSNPTVTYSAQVGYYTRFFDVVFFSLSVTVATISGGSGDARVSLPVACAYINHASLRTSNVTLPSGVIMLSFICDVGTTGRLIGYRNASTPSATPISGLTAGSQIIASGFYFAA